MLMRRYLRSTEAGIARETVSRACDSTGFRRLDLVDQILEAQSLVRGADVDVLEAFGGSARSSA